MTSTSQPYLVSVDTLYLEPGWFQKYRHGDHASMVSITNGVKTVALGGETLRINNCDLIEGTPVLVWLSPGSGHFYCDSVEAIDARLAAYEAAEQAKENAKRIKHNAMRDAAIKFNAKFKIPVQWRLAQKDVLSGLSETSIGDGRKANSVNHIRLDEPLQEGRLKRNAGDLLCTSANGYNGARYTEHSPFLYDGDGNAYTPAISCAACIKAASRWITQD